MSRLIMEYGVATSLRPISGAWRQMADAALASLDISNSQGWALVQLARQKRPVRQRELAGELGIAEASLVRTLHQLERAGYVIRTPDKEDRRSNLLTLTPTGTSMARRIDERLVALRRELLAGLSDADVAATLRVFDHVAARLAERQGKA